MKACFYIGPGGNDWFGKFFPGRSPGELSIAGKSWCRHMVDQCSRLKITDIYIADCYYRDELLDRMGDGDYWSLQLHYLPTEPCPAAEQLLKQHRDVLPEDDLLIVWGLVMPEPADIDQLLSELREVKTMPEAMPDGIWLIREGKLYECACPLLKMSSLQEYFDLNFHLLEKPGIYNLPGYSSSDGCVFGMDVLILPGCELEKPVLIQDNVRLERGVALSGGVIIGKEVLINSDTRLEHSLVLDNTCIGKHMFFRNMIIDGSRVIDVTSGVLVELDDAFLSGHSKIRIVNAFAIIEFLIALLLCVVGLPLYLITRPFKFLLQKQAFFFFAFQIYPKCFLVLIGKAHLVRYGLKDNNYVFRFSDQWLLHQDEHQRQMDDIYFYYNRSVANIWRTVVLSLFKRLFVFSALPSDRRSTHAEKSK